MISRPASITPNHLFFRNVAPAAMLQPFVAAYRFIRSQDHLRVPLVIPSIPDGAIEIYLQWGDVPLFYRGAHDSSVTQTRSSIYGPHTRGFLAELTGTIDGINISFRPGGFFALFGIDVHHLTGRHFPLDDVIGHNFMTVVEAMCFQPAAARVELLNAFLVHRMNQHKFIKVVPELRQAVSLSTQNPRRLTVSALAHQCSVSTSTLNRLFQRHVGLGPKQYLRLQRLWTALRLRKSTGVSLANIALQAGYFDQAHFANEINSVMNFSFQELKALLEQQNARFFQDEEAI